MQTASKQLQSNDGSNNKAQVVSQKKKLLVVQWYHENGKNVSATSRKLILTVSKFATGLKTRTSLENKNKTPKMDVIVNYFIL